MNKKVLYWASRAVLSLPAFVQRVLAGGDDRRDGYTFDPGLRLLSVLNGQSKPPAADDILAQRRQNDALALAVQGPLVPVAAVRDLQIDGAAGPLRARHYSAGIENAPLLVYFHGGGFVYGNLDTHDVLTRLLCSAGGFSVLAVDYRLVPEVRFPAPIEDGCAAFRWAQKNAATLGADPARIGVGGDSAGGNVAAVVSQLLRENGPVCQLLIYPATDRTHDHPSMISMASGAFLTTEMVRWYHAQYAAQADAADPRISPLVESNLGGLPPALIASAGFDPLRDEVEAYAQALQAAGTPATLHRFDALPHGFASMVGIHLPSRAALVALAESTKELLR